MEGIVEDTELLCISEEDRFITTYKSIYQAMTAKHDCKTRMFFKEICITKEDIFELNDAVVEKLKTYQDAGFTITPSVSFEGKRLIEFSSWSEFCKHRWDESHAITSITIVWEFNAILPKIAVPQRHALVVKISDGLKPEEMLNLVISGKLENLHDIEKQVCPVVARADFVNLVLGDELLHIVEVWNKRLKDVSDEKNKIVELLIRHRRKIAYLMDSITKVIVFICGISVIVNYFKSLQIEHLSGLTIDNVCAIIWITGVITITFSFINKLSEWFSNIFYKTIEPDENNHVFDINRGDSKVRDKINKNKRKRNFMSVLSVIGTVIINISCGILCSIITK